jgi:DNA helicase-4
VFLIKFYLSNYSFFSLQLYCIFRDFILHFATLLYDYTYRNSEEFIDIAGKFVMSNPNQYKKNLKSDKHNSEPIIIKGYSIDIIATIKSVYLSTEN